MLIIKWILNFNFVIERKKVKLLSHVQLCNPMACSPPGSSIHGIFQARVLEWLNISFSRGSSRPKDWTQVSYIAFRIYQILSQVANYLGIFQKE